MTSAAPLYPSRIAYRARAAPNDRERLHQVDAARVVATLGVLWVHVSERYGLDPRLSALGRFGTSFYIVAAVLFALSSSAPSRGHGSLRRQARRVLLPFVTWSAIYGGLYGVWAAQRGESWSELSRWWGPFAGTAIHLWFLPFAVLVTVLSTAFGPWLLKCPPRTLSWATPLGALLAYAACHGYLFLHLDRFWLWQWHLHRLDRWSEELPLVVLALGYGAIWVQGRRSGRTVEGALGLAAMLGFMLIQAMYLSRFAPLDWPGAVSRILSHLGGLCLLTAALALAATSAPVRWLAGLGKDTYFVFLAHMLVLELISPFPDRLRGLGTPGIACITSVSVFAICVVLNRGLRCYRPLRWLSQ